MYCRVSLIGRCCFLLLFALLIISALLATPHQVLAQSATPLRPASGAGYIQTDQIIVKYRASAHVGVLDFIQSAPRLQMLNLVAGVAANHLRAMTDDTHVFQLTSRQTVTDVQAIADRMRQLPEVEFAEPDRILQPLVIPNDPQWVNQWQYWDTYGMNLPTAWDITTGASSTVVAVIDTGYRPHGDLAGRFIQGYDFIGNVNIANDGNGRDTDARDPGDWITTAENASGPFAGCPIGDSSWHGTHVAGTIGAISNNGIGVSGINWFARILPVRVLGKCGGYTSDIIDGMRWAAGLPVAGVLNNANPARVMNLSLGGGGACGAAQQSAINEINAVGAIIVVAAGNSFSDTQYFNPASCNGVIAVGATNQSGVRAYYSNYGALVDVSAPGGEQFFTNDPGGILSTLNAGTTVPGADNYVYYQGTSMATPHVVGLVSLMLTLSPTLNFTRTEAIIKATARPFGPGSDCADKLCGSGIIDAFAALSATLPIAASSNAPTILGHATNLTATINGSGLVYTWNYGDGVTGAGATVSHIYPLSGMYTAVVTATNGSYTRTALTLVTITNQAPIANAGTNQTATGFSLVTLNGSASTDPDGHIPLSYGWRQTGGPAVVLNSAVFSQPNFIAPAAPTVLTFTLSVTDARGLVSAASARTVVTVVDTPNTSILVIDDSPTTLGYATTLTATANGSNVTYTWGLGDGTTGAGATVSHIYPLSGTYTAVVTATNSANRITSTAIVTITNQAPVAVVNPNQNATVNSQVTLDGSASFDPDGHTPLTYGWRQTGGMAVVLNSAVISRPIFTAPPMPAVLTFTLTVTDARGLVSAASARAVIAVSDSPIINIVAINNSPTTLGHTTILTATASGSNAGYTWDFGDGTTGAGAILSHIYALSGTYTAVVTATNGTNSLVATTPVTVTNQAPVAVVSPSQSVLVNDMVILDGSGAFDPDGHTPLTYGWKQTSGSTVLLSDASISRTTFAAPAFPDVLIFTLVVTDARGLITAAPAQTFVTVTNAPDIVVTATNSSPTTLGNITYLTATSTISGAAYIWSFGDGAGTTSPGAATNYTYLFSGTYTALVTATNGVFTQSISTLVVIANQPPVPVISPDQSVLVSTTVMLDGSGSYDPDGHTPLTYGWTQSGGVAVMLNSTVISQPTFMAPDTSGVLTFTLTVTDARGLVNTVSARTTITVYDTPVANIVAVNNSPTPQGQTTILTATADGSTVVYTWGFGDGIAGVGATVSHVYPLSGTYTTVVTATNSTGSITTTTLVTITPPAYTCAPLSNISIIGAPVGIVGSLQQFSVMVSPISATVPLTYTWQADGQQTVITQTTLYTSLISYSWPVTGQHAIMVTVSGACSTLNATTLVAIHSAYISYMPLILR